MKLFFDESGIQKLHLKNGSYNDYFGFFILGGIALENEISEEIRSFFEDNNEYKSSENMKGDFLNIIQDEIHIDILKKLLNNDIFIHFEIYDLFYHSISRIILEIYGDSSISHLEINDYKDFLWKKFYNKNDVISMFLEYNFPKFSNESKREEFYSKIFVILEDYQHSFLENDLNGKSYLRQKKKNENMNCISEMLFNKFWEIYKLKMLKYDKFELFFDKQEKVQKELKQIIRLNSVNFIDSKNSIEIQISDFICGLVRRFFEYIDKTPIENIIHDLYKLEKHKGFYYFKEILKKTCIINENFLNFSLSMNSEIKAEYVIQMHYSKDKFIPTMHRINKNLQILQVTHNYNLSEDFFEK